MKNDVLEMSIKNEKININRDTDLSRINDINNKQYNKNVDNIKSIFQYIVRNCLTLNDINRLISEETLKVKIPKDVVEKLKDGSARFLNDKQGDMLPSIIGKDGKIIRQIRIEDLGKQLTPEKVSQLNNMVIQQQLADIYLKLEEIQEYVEDIIKGQRNDRYGKIDSGIYMYQQALNCNDSSMKNIDISNAKQSISEAVNGLKKEIIDKMDYFKTMPKENTLSYYFNILKREYTSSKISKRAKEIYEDLYYMTLGVYSLIQIYSDSNNLEQQKEIVLKPLKDIILEVNNINLLSWIPFDKQNRCQFEFVKNIPQSINLIENNINSFNNKDYVIEFNKNELTEGGYIK